MSRGIQNSQEGCVTETLWLPSLRSDSTRSSASAVRADHSARTHWGAECVPNMSHTGVWQSPWGRDRQGNWPTSTINLKALVQTRILNLLLRGLNSSLTSISNSSFLNIRRGQPWEHQSGNKHVQLPVPPPASTECDACLLRFGWLILKEEMRAL